MQPRGLARGRTLLSAVALIFVLSPAAHLGAQGPATAFRMTVDPASSLAWYQTDPHTQMMWATTCPGDPFWRPGESRNAGWDLRGLPPPKVGAGNVRDTIIPLYRRPVARPLCSQAVQGKIVAEDTVNWRGLNGTVVIRPESLTSGLPMRDHLASRVVFKASRYPEISFIIDSLINIRPGDTLRADAVGRFNMVDVERPMVAQVVSWRERLGRRVLARLQMEPWDLIEVYGASPLDLQLGVVSGVWKTIHFGVDVILRPDTSTGGKTSARAGGGGERD